jgi:hypothetical protein
MSISSGLNAAIGIGRTVAGTTRWASPGLKMSAADIFDCETETIIALVACLTTVQVRKLASLDFIALHLAATYPATLFSIRTLALPVVLGYAG